MKNINKKLMWLSNAPWAATGYGCQTRIFTPRIKTLGYDVAITAFWGLEGGRLNAGGIPVYAKGFHKYGQDVIRAHTQEFGATRFISLVDAWVYDHRDFDGVDWLPWFPVDSEPLSPRILEAVKHAKERIVFSKFGERMVKEAGLDCHYVPHGIETDVFKPVDGIKFREAKGIDRDAFLVGMVAANKGTPSRKAFTAQISAFAKFHKKHTDSVLYIHAMSGEHGEPATENLVHYADYAGLTVGENIIFPDTYSLLSNKYTDETMAMIYSAMDVHMLVSMGEGFGIPIVEAQACGTPVIVGDWTSMSELCFSGWKVGKKNATPLWTPLDANQYMPHEGAIFGALENAYAMRGNDKYRKEARKGALKYDADKVTQKYWKPFLEKVFEND